MLQRVSSLDEVGNIDAPPGSRKWAVAVLQQAKLAISKFESDAKNAGDWIELLKQHAAWEALGIPSFGLLCATKLKISEDEADALAKAKKGESVGAVLKAHGGDRKSDAAKQDQGDVITLKRGSTGASYLAARLRRDAPEICDRLAAGEFPSVRAAAIEAGIVKVPTNLQKAQKAFLKLTDGEREAFAEWMDLQGS